jgi:hypothetical protein
MSYKWNDILIVGDSFCADRSEKLNWPQIFTTALTAESFQKGIDPRGRGFPGASWWSARKCLLEELEKSPAKVLVFCHTEPYRIPNEDNLGLNTRSVIEDIVYVPKGGTIPSDDFKRAAKGYYEYIISQPFHEWAYRQWFGEIDSIIEEHNIEKSIHLFCFQGPYNQHTFKKGVTVSIPLITFQKTPVWRIVKDSANHYFTGQNIELGMNLANIIKNYPGDGTRLNTRIIGS